MTTNVHKLKSVAAPHPHPLPCSDTNPVFPCLDTWENTCGDIRRGTTAVKKCGLNDDDEASCGYTNSPTRGLPSKMPGAWLAL